MSTSMSRSMRGARWSARGAWRGRGNNNRARQDQASEASTLSSLPFGPSIDTINTNTLLIDREAPAIENAKYIASYNWLNGKDPIVLVPGSPPAWAPPAEDPQLKQDSEDVFRDFNAARYASYPIEPALRSILALNPNFDLQMVDIMGCGSTLGNLLRFASCQSRPFRFDVDLVGDTVFFVRREISPTAIIQDLKGYGHTFPEEYTTWDADVSNSCSHQRIVQYEFGGLRLLLRSETDGYLPSKESGQPVAKPAEERSSLLGALGSMSVGGNEMPSQGRNLELRMQGTVVSQDSVFDIKTRMLSPHKIYDMGEILPRLWMNQTPNFLLAYHRYGLFNKPTVKDVRSEIKNWETENASTLGKFHAILKRIVDTVRESDVHQVEVSWDGQGPLRITEQLGEGRRALPLNLCSHWESME